MFQLQLLFRFRDKTHVISKHKDSQSMMWSGRYRLKHWILAGRKTKTKTHHDAENTPVMAVQSLELLLIGGMASQMIMKFNWKQKHQPTFPWQLHRSWSWILGADFWYLETTKTCNQNRHFWCKSSSNHFPKGSRTRKPSGSRLSSQSWQRLETLRGNTKKKPSPQISFKLIGDSRSNLRPTSWMISWKVETMGHGFFFILGVCLDNYSLLDSEISRLFHVYKSKNSSLAVPSRETQRSQRPTPICRFLLGGKTSSEVFVLGSAVPALICEKHL